uniref:Nucleotide-binding alpha-beta plait domain-containing protein n=1 Tax=Tanacetum cinerariifolium TaxID=118510 RepID=A0A699HJT8_TANCI|nr:nucleotide-binding alpha-beta plait domain-containing protein [Tanacetum cinerariifolium]
MFDWLSVRWEVETGNSGSAWVVPDKDDILEDASEIEQIGVNGVVETANFGEASLHMNVNGMEHEKISSSSSLTSSSWTDISLKMKEVGPDGEKQSKEAKDEDIQVIKHEFNFDSICYFFSITICKYNDMNLAKQVDGSSCEAFWFYSLLVVMGYQRSKEDDVQRISTSVFVTNFPDYAYAKDLWNACKQYGYVVDAFIPNRRTIAGKKYGFVRFIKVFDVDRLVNNLCTAWIGSHRIHANVAKFHRPKGFSGSKACNHKGEPKESANGSKPDSNYMSNPKSYAYVVKDGDNALGERDSNPIKELGSLANLKVVLENERFSDINLRYLGGMWVMIVFKVSWRVTWVNIKGVPLKVWNENTFKRIASKWGSFLTEENSEEDNLHSKRICIHTKGMLSIREAFKIIFQGKVYLVRAKEISGWNPDFELNNDENSDSEEDRSVGDFKEVAEVSDPNLIIGENSSDHIGTKSEDPFNIYSLLNKNKNSADEYKESNSKESLKFPHGFTPNVTDEEYQMNLHRHNKGGMEFGGSGQVRKSVIPRTGGSFLTVIEELIKVGNTMGYNMEGCTKNIEEI